GEEGGRGGGQERSGHWGWLIVNFEKYRQKARKAAWSAAYTASGRDAERKRQSRRVQSHPVGPGPQTQPEAHLSALQLQLPDGIDRESWAEWIGYRKERGLPMSSGVLALHIKTLLPDPPEV